MKKSYGNERIYGKKIPYNIFYYVIFSHFMLNFSNPPSYLKPWQLVKTLPQQNIFGNGAPAASESRNSECKYSQTYDSLMININYKGIMLIKITNFFRSFWIDDRFFKIFAAEWFKFAESLEQNHYVVFKNRHGVLRKSPTNLINSTIDVKNSTSYLKISMVYFKSSMSYFKKLHRAFKK